MKKTDKRYEEPEMRDEYDFSDAVRGKHYRDYRTGHTVHIHKGNGTMEVHYFTEEDGAVMLDPDIKRHFPNSDTVNKALRAVVTHG